MLVAAGTGEDETVFLSYERYFQNALVVQAVDTGKKVSEIRFPDKLGMQHSWALPELVDGERALFFDSTGRRIRLFACAGLNRAQPLGRRRKVYVAEVGAWTGWP
ncbi:hypothetical protein [Streptomyces prunicolor]|uniref:hypothetical protein n=1 Tax=Streptomyces prunicolor TaxID=67348 RepID=UPI003424669C